MGNNFSWWDWIRCIASTVIPILAVLAGYAGHSLQNVEMFWKLVVMFVGELFAIGFLLIALSNHMQLRRWPHHSDRFQMRDHALFFGLLGAIALFVITGMGQGQFAGEVRVVFLWIGGFNLLIATFTYIWIVGELRRNPIPTLA